MIRSLWQDIARQVQKHRDEILSDIKPPLPDWPHELPRRVTTISKQLLTPRELEITESTLEVLVEFLANGT